MDIYAKMNSTIEILFCRYFGEQNNNYVNAFVVVKLLSSRSMNGVMRCINY